MAFTWKDKKDIFKGEGIYHLTFAVNNRIPLLGELQPLSFPDADGHTAWTKATELGKIVQTRLNILTADYPHLQILAKQLMPDHLHVVVYMHAGWTGSIKMIARSYSQGCSKQARRLVAEKRAGNGGSASGAAGSVSGVVGSVSGVVGSVPGVAGSVPLVLAQSDCADKDSILPPLVSAPSALPLASAPSITSYDCGNGANTLFSTPFIRTLARRGQLQAMIRYVHANPDNAWLRRQRPDLYVIRHRQQYAGLLFDTMGKTRLLD